MQDSDITFRFKAEGIEQIRAEASKLGVELNKMTRNANGTYSATGKLAGAQDVQASSTRSAARATDDASRSQQNYFAHIAKTTVQSAIINKLFLELVDVAGQAVQQVDLMNNFPATMASLGQATNVSNEAFQSLSSYVGQVGGNLADATSAVTRFTGVTGNVKSAVAIFTGLNNALIAGDSSMEEQRLAATQFAQAFERGKPDMKEWLSLTQNMSNQLGMVAREMGYVNATELGEALRTGEESMSSFTTTLTQLSTGTGPIAEQAMARMSGMQFAFNVMKNTMVQGLAAIINAFGRTNIVSFFNFLTQVIQVVTQAVVGLINAFFNLINMIRGLFGFAPLEGLKKDIEVVADGTGDISDGLGDAKKEADKLNKSLASFDKMNVLPDKTSGKSDDDASAGGANFDDSQISSLLGAFDEIGTKMQEVSVWAKIVAGVIGGLTAIKFAQGIVDQFNGIAKSATVASENAQKFKTFLYGDGADKKNIFGRASDSAKTLASGVAGAVAGVSAALFTPIGLAVLAIAAVVAAIVVLYNTNEDFKRGFDNAWNGFIGIIQTVATVISDSIGKAFNWVKEQVEKLPAPFKEAMAKIGEFFKPVGDFFNDLAKKLGIVGPPMESFGAIIGIVAAGLSVLAAAWVAWNVALVAFNIIGGIASVIMTVLTSPITLVVLAIVALVAIIVLAIMYWDEIMAAAVGAWNGILAAWDTAVQWFAENVIVPIVGFFTKLWNDIVAIFNAAPVVLQRFFSQAWENIKMTWNVVVQWFQDLWNYIVAVFQAVPVVLKRFFSEAWENIKTTWNNVVQWFRDVWNNIVFVFNVVGRFFGDVFKDAWKNIQTAFSNFSRFFGDVWTNIKNAFAGVGSFFGDTFKGAFNGVAGIIEGFINNAIGLINKLITGVNNVTSSVGIPKIPPLSRVSLPRLARGGVVEQATLAMIGEDGKEAVVPLENNLEWIDALAAKINSNNSSGQPVQLTVQIGEERIITKVIELINDKSYMSGRNRIIV